MSSEKINININKKYQKTLYLFGNQNGSFFKLLPLNFSTISWFYGLEKVKNNALLICPDFLIINYT